MEKIGVDRAREMAQKADLILYVVDSSFRWMKMMMKSWKCLLEKRRLSCITKLIFSTEIQPEILKEKTGHPVIPISAKEEKGITELEETD